MKEVGETAQVFLAVSNVIARSTDPIIHQPTCPSEMEKVLY